MPRSCEAAHEDSKVEAQRRERFITSLLITDPWSKGNYSRHIRGRPWLWMVSRRGYLLPAGCRGSFSKQPRSENGGGGGTERVSRKRVHLSNTWKIMIISKHIHSTCNNHHTNATQKFLLALNLWSSTNGLYHMP